MIFRYFTLLISIPIGLNAIFTLPYFNLFLPISFLVALIVCCLGYFLLEMVDGTCMSKWGVFGVSCRIPYKFTLLWHLVAALSRNIGVNCMTTCTFQKEQFFVVTYFHKGFFLILIIFFGAFIFKLSIWIWPLFFKMSILARGKKRQYIFYRFERE